MKKLIGCLVVVLIIAAGVVGCKKIIKNIFPGFNFDAPAVTVVLPPIPYAPPNEMQIGSFPQSFNLDSAVKANTNGSFGAADVTSVKVKQITFNVTNANQQNNLSNFESVRFTLSSNTGNTSPVEIAAFTFPDSYADTYTYTPTNAPELRPYLNGTQLVYNVYGKLRRPTTVSLTLTVQVTLVAK